MWNPFKKKLNTEEAGEASSNCDAPRFRVENGRIIQSDGQGGIASDGRTAGNDGAGEKIGRLYGPERFHSHFCKALGFIGRRRGLVSLQIDENDADIRLGSEALYRRLTDDGRLGWVDTLADEALTDWIVIFLVFAPMGKEAVGEILANRRAVVRAARVDDDVSEGTQDDGE